MEILVKGLASAKALRHSEADVLKAQEEDGVFVSKRVVTCEAGETRNVS